MTDPTAREAETMAADADNATLRGRFVSLSGLTECGAGAHNKREQ